MYESLVHVANDSIWDEFETMMTAGDASYPSWSLREPVLKKLLSAAPIQWARQQGLPVKQDRLLDRVAELLAFASADDLRCLTPLLDGAVSDLAAPRGCDFYEALIAHLRPLLGETGSERYRWCGWFIGIIDFLWNRRGPKQALGVIEDAWTCALWFPNQFSEVRISATLALREAMVRSTAKVDRETTSDPEGILRNIKRIKEAARQIELMPRGYGDLVILRLRCALAESSLLEVDATRGQIGRSRSAIRSLRAGLQWCVEVEPWDFKAVLDRLDGSVTEAGKPTITEAIVKLVRHSSNAGDLVGSSETSLAIDYLEGVNMDQRRTAGFAFDLAEAAGNQRLNGQVLLQFAKSAHGGELDTLSPSIRAGLAQRFTDLARKSSAIYHRNDSHYTALYWEWEALQVSARLCEHKSAPVSLGENSERPGRSSGPAALAATKASVQSVKTARLLKDLSGLERAQSNDQPLRFVLSLRSLAMAEESEWNLLSGKAEDILRSARLWQARVGTTALRVEDPFSERVDRRATFRVGCLLVADAVAREFHGELCPQIQENLASVNELPPRKRVQHARKAVFLARKAGRWMQSVDATLKLLKALHDCEDRDGVSDAVTDLCEGFLTEISSSASGIGLYELLKSGSQALGKIAEWLAARNYAEQAFLVASVSAGWLCQALTADPSLVDDYEAVQRVKLQKGESAREMLFRRMEHRMLMDIHHKTVLTDQSAGVLTIRGRASIQFLIGEAVWALVAVPDVGDDTVSKFEAVMLPVSHAELQKLADRIWVELRPSRAGRGRNGKVRGVPSLRRLHDVCIAPIEGVLHGIDEVIFTTHGLIARLPLHAARSHEGYLIERVRCRYFSHRWNTQARNYGQNLSTAIVGGWDPGIGGPDEARSVGNHLAGMGYAPEKSRTAVKGRMSLLAPTREVRLLHLVAHGELHAGWQAFESKLHLSASVKVSAGDWMRAGCRAEFAFLNACGLGGAIPHSGDLSGFPLALRVRGVQGSLTAMADISAKEAHRFATMFYSELAVTDTFAAYVSSVRAILALKQHPSAWVPYIYEGETVEGPLPVKTARRVQVRTAGNADRRRRKRRY